MWNWKKWKIFFCLFVSYHHHLLFWLLLKHSNRVIIIHHQHFFIAFFYIRMIHLDMMIWMWMWMIKWNSNQTNLFILKMKIFFLLVLIVIQNSILNIHWPFFFVSNGNILRIEIYIYSSLSLRWWSSMMMMIMIITTNIPHTHLEINKNLEKIAQFSFYYDHIIFGLFTRIQIRVNWLNLSKNAMVLKPHYHHGDDHHHQYRILVAATFIIFYILISVQLYTPKCVQVFFWCLAIFDPIC